MVDLSFQVESVQQVAYAAAPHLAFRLAIAAAPAMPIQSVLLRCQIRIEPTRRQYRAENPERLLEIFGPPDRWGQTMHSLLWTHSQAIVPAFAGGTSLELAVPCSFDFSLAGTKYFAALEEGDVPLCFLFSGTVFYQSERAGLQVAPIAHDKQADFRLPVAVWKQLMEHYHPNSTWLRLDRGVADRLLRYKALHGLPTWERAIESLLARETEPVVS